jgi:hypothetical protein
MNRNLGWLRRRVAWLLNQDLDEPDQDFAGRDGAHPWEEIDEAISAAYEDELELAIQETDRELFIVSEQLVWPSGQRTLALPTHLTGAQIERITDETYGTPGELLWVTTYNSGEVSFLDHATLQWGTSGPAGAKTLRIFYLAQAQDLVSPLDEPTFIPSRFRRLLIWGAAAVIRRGVDEDDTPQSWVQQQHEMRLTMWQALSKGRPRASNRGGVYSPEEP